MRQLIPIIAIPILIAWGILMRSETFSPRRDLAFIAVITLLFSL
jgi:hypothetical protein